MYMCRSIFLLQVLIVLICVNGSYSSMYIKSHSVRKQAKNNEKSRFSEEMASSDGVSTGLVVSISKPIENPEKPSKKGKKDKKDKETAKDKKGSKKQKAISESDDEVIKAKAEDEYSDAASEQKPSKSISDFISDFFSIRWVQIALISTCAGIALCILIFLMFSYVSGYINERNNRKRYSEALKPAYTSDGNQKDALQAAINM
ncbi:hypothetical protein NEAUS04_0888 [Nematocida ausubeli]|nr:hypothetical protein NEAUS05_0040 [Nematocida ausubeli]KAI5162127.1 hypothetical protein NEAUS04_0888 [Nematocida ausubeli]